MSDLTDAERLVVLSPCACGHDINDHGELVGCWSCPDQGDECSVSFESMLAERVARIKAEAIATARERIAAAIEVLAADWDRSGFDMEVAQVRAALKAADQ